MPHYVVSKHSVEPMVVGRSPVKSGTKKVTRISPLPTSPSSAGGSLKVNNLELLTNPPRGGLLVANEKISDVRGGGGTNADADDVDPSLSEYYERVQTRGTGGALMSAPGTPLDSTRAIVEMRQRLSSGPTSLMPVLQQQPAMPFHLGQNAASSSTSEEVGKEKELTDQYLSMAVLTDVAGEVNDKGVGNGTVRNYKKAESSDSDLSSSSNADSLGVVKGGLETKPFDIEAITYPYRAPKSRASATVLNRMLDDALFKLRLSSTNGAYIGPTLKEETNPRYMTTNPSPYSTTTSTTPSLPRGISQGSSINQGGGLVGNETPSSAFDRTLGTLLDQASLKTKCLVDFVHMYAGTDFDEGDRPRSAAGAVNGGSGAISKPVTPSRTKKLPPSLDSPSKADMKMTMRDQLTMSEVKRKALSDRLADMENAARQVLAESKEKRLAVEASNRELGEKIEELKFLISQKDQDAQLFYLKLNQEKQEKQALEEAKEQARLQLEEERKQAGVPVDLNSAVSLIANLKLQLARSEAKGADDTDHLLKVIEQKKSDMRELNANLTITEDLHRNHKKASHQIQKDMDTKFRKLMEQKQELDQLIEAHKQALAPNPWLHCDLILKISEEEKKREEESTVSVGGEKEQEVNGVSSELDDAVISHARNVYNAAVHRASREREAKRSLTLFGPSMALVKAAYFPTSLTESTSTSTSAVVVMPSPMKMSMALDYIADILDAKLIHDKESEQKNKWENLNDFAEYFFMEKYSDASFALDSLRQCYTALLKYGQLAEKESKIRKRIRSKHVESVMVALEKMSTSEAGGGKQPLTPSHGSAHHASVSGPGALLHHENSESNMSVHSAASYSSNGRTEEENSTNGAEEVSLFDAETSRFLMRINLFLRMFQLDHTRTYSTRLNTLVSHFLDKFCKGGKTVREFLGSAVLISQDDVEAEEGERQNSTSLLDQAASATSVLEQLNQEEASPITKNTVLESSLISSNISINNIDNKERREDETGGGGGDEDMTVNGDDQSMVSSVYYPQNREEAKDEPKVKWGINEKVLVSRKELLLTLLFDTSGQNNGGQDPMGLPSQSRSGGVRQKGTTSAILLEIQKGMPKSAPPAYEVEGILPIQSVFLEPSHWRCPLLTSLASTDTILDFLKQVGCLKAVPYEDPNAPTPSSSGGTGAPASRGGGNIASATGGGGRYGSMSGVVVPTAGEPMVDFDEFLELLCHFFDEQSELRIAELETMFKHYDTHPIDLTTSTTTSSIPSSTTIAASNNQQHGFASTGSSVGRGSGLSAGVPSPSTSQASGAGRRRILRDLSGERGRLSRYDDFKNFIGLINDRIVGISAANISAPTPVASAPSGQRGGAGGMKSPVPGSTKGAMPSSPFNNTMASSSVLGGGGGAAAASVEGIGSEYAAKTLNDFECYRIFKELHSMAETKHVLDDPQMFAVLMFRGDHIALLHDDPVIVAHKEHLREEAMLRRRQDMDLKLKLLQQSHEEKDDEEEDEEGVDEDSK